MAHLEFPENLFENIRSQSCILCTGVRFASAAGYPDWDSLLESMADSLGGDDETLTQLRQEGKRLTVAGYLKRKLGPEALETLINDVFGSDYDPSDLHNAVGEIPFAGALTTGYDALLESVLLRDGEQPTVFTYAEGGRLRTTAELNHFVVKAHGDVENNASLVVTQRDFRRQVAPNQAYRAFFENLYRTQTFLVVGFSPDDPDFRLMVERLWSSFREPVVDHYALLFNVSEPEAEELYANYRLRVISFDQGDEPMAGLQAALEDLRDQWKERGGEVLGPEDPTQRAAWLRQQVGPVDLRVDVMAAEGLSVSESQLAAIKAAAESVVLRDLDAETVCKLGNVRLFSGDTNGALACYEEALRKNKSMGEALLNMHHACAEAKRFDDALEHLNAAVELDDSLRVIPERYELKAVIGRGTTGTIYEAHDGKEDRDVTVKVLRASFVREHLSPEAWQEEAALLTELEHENITKIYDAILEDGRCILVTEGLKGQSLSRLLREGGKLTPDKAAKILGQVCEGLTHAHEQGILHLDITPSNIFIKDDDTVVLMDFRSSRSQKGRSVVVKKGSEGFQAPELLAGAGGDELADIYSLGAVLYNMLTDKIALGSFLPAGELVSTARRYDSLITRSLRAMPDDRPQSVDKFAKALAGGAEDVVLPDSEDDVEGWCAVLAMQPDNQQAIETLEKLERGFREESDWESLIGLLMEKAGVETDSEARQKDLRDLARIFERELDDQSSAFTTLQQAFRENTSNIEIRNDLERLAKATGMWNELLQEYNHLVQNLREPKLGCDWLVRMGRLYANELGYDDYAIASYQQALNMDANRADALTELAEVLGRKEDHKELARTLKRLADLEEDVLRKIQVLKQLATLYLTELDSDEEAILAYRKILEIEPANAAVVAALDGLYRKQEMWDELVQLLESRIDVTEVAEDQLSFRHSLAEVLGEKLDKPSKAIEQFQALLEANPDDHKALRGLEKLYSDTGREEEYLEILDKRIAAAPTDKEKVELCRRMAKQWEDQEGGAKQAAEYYEKIVEIDTKDDEGFKALVRLYWAVPDHEKLADTYRRHIAICKKADDKVPLYAGLGMVYEEHLDQIDKAIEVFHNLRSIDDKNKNAVASLARLYQKDEAWKQAVEMLEKQVPLEESVDGQADLFCTMGVLQYQKLNNDQDAELNLVKARELKEDHVGAMSALAHLYRERKDFGKAARMLREVADATANELEKVERLHQSGATYLQDLEDEDQAMEVFEIVLTIDPEHVPTGLLVAPIYEKREQTDRAETVYEMLVRKADAKDRPALIELNTHLGQMAQVNSNEERAVTAYRAAYDLDPTNQTSLQQLANILYDRDEVAEAAKLFQALLVHRRDAMDPEDTVQVFFKLGDLKDRQGEQHKALNMFEKALDIDPKSADVLPRAATLYQDKGDLEAVLRCRRALLENATEDDQKMALAEDLGDLLANEMKRPNQAVDAYKQVTAIKPDHRRVLNKIMEIFIEQRKWEEAIMAMGKIEDYEGEALHRSRLHYTAGVIYRDELKKPEDAAYHFDQALMKDPTFRKAFDALKKLYTNQGNFKALAHAYQVMLERLPEATSVDEEVGLWKELGELHRDKIQDRGEAIKAFEKADSLARRDADLKLTLASLYAEAGPDAHDKAVEANQALVRLNPMGLHAYRELQRLYTEMKQADKAWCVSGVLAVLGKGTDADTKAYEAFRSDTPRRLERALSNDLWNAYLYHPSQSRVLNNVFAVLAPIVAPMVARPDSSYGLRAKEKVDMAGDKRPFVQAASYARQAIGGGPNEVYVQGEMSEPMSTVLAGSKDDNRAVLRVSPRVVKTESMTELTYWFGKHYALMRPEHQLAFSVSSAEVLRAVTLAALKLVDPSVRVSGDAALLEKLSSAFSRQLPPGSLDFLSNQADSLRAATTELAMNSWLDGVDHSVTRAGLVLCDDLETTAKMLATEPAPRGKDSRARVAELFAFAVSEKYFQLRDTLNLTVGK